METPPRPPNGRNDSSPLGFFSPFTRDDKDESMSALTLLDVMETYFDSHLDLLQRKLQKHSDRLKTRAEGAFRLKDLSGDVRLSENFDREVKNFKLKVATRMTSLAASWQSAKVVRTRDKMSFFFGVMSLLFSALMFGLAPQWIHIAYTVLGLYLLPLRAYTYKKRAWHYFLFDLCYYVTILNFIYIWFLPSSPGLFIACYTLSHGSLASAVVTWRNSLVFHDSDKVTSLFIHIYPPFAFTVIRHFYPNANARFPALSKVPHLEPGRALFLSGVIYLIWQLLYWKYVLVNRRDKIRSGQRTTSFSFLLNDKHGAIGKALSSIPERFREAAFMAGQFVYALLTELPAIFLLYRSSLWSGIFLVFVFGVSVWNGGGYYIEVFGRKFERELEALRKELAETSAREGRSSPDNASPLLANHNLPSTPTIITTPSIESDTSATSAEQKKEQ